MPSTYAINILLFWAKSIKLGVVFSPSVYSLHRTASGSFAGGVPPDPKNHSSFATQKSYRGKDSLPTTICFANRPAGLCLCGQTYRRCGRARRFASPCGLLSINRKGAGVMSYAKHGSEAKQRAVIALRSTTRGELVAHHQTHPRGLLNRVLAAISGFPGVRLPLEGRRPCNGAFMPLSPDAKRRHLLNRFSPPDFSPSSAQ